MKHEYHEGPQAGENFKALATAVFQAKKTTVPAKAKPVKKALRKASGKDKA
jgi:transcriptional/translational regulatory protein YebC/TACO1